MTQERKDYIAFGGSKRTVVGPDLETGQDAPRFTATDNDWNEVDPITDSAGRVRVLLALPSLETSVCDRETRKFNEDAAGMGDDIVIYALSHDTPLTQKRWCAAAGIERVITLSDHVLGDFGPKYGTLMKEIRLLRRAAFVVGRDGKLVYVEYLPENGMEPDYDAVLAAIRSAR